MNYVNFLYSHKGKIGRLAFLGGTFLALAVPAILWIMIALPLLLFPESYSTPILSVAMAIGFLAAIYGQLCLNIKRARDMGSLLLVLLLFVPGANFVSALFFIFYPGKHINGKCSHSCQH